MSIKIEIEIPDDGNCMNCMLFDGTGFCSRFNKPLTERFYSVKKWIFLPFEKCENKVKEEKI